MVYSKFEEHMCFLSSVASGVVQDSAFLVIVAEDGV
jgi:hypothetical protein